MKTHLQYDPTMGWLTRAYTVNSDMHYSYDELSRLKTVSVVKRDGVTLAHTGSDDQYLRVAGGMP
jgi:hypothetical protein